METTIDLVPDENFFESGITKYIKWDYNKYPHMVIFGVTGSGKTYLLKIILGRIAKHIPQSELLICDYKSDEDFSFLDGLPNFYRFDKCTEGLAYALKLLQDRQHGITTERHFFGLIFDEWASYINNLERKQAEFAKQSLATLLMLGRSFNIHVVVSQQRLDAAYFSSARDNFSVIFGMGTLSKESVQMIFSEYKDVIDRNKSQGHGSLVLGNQFKNVIVPTVQNKGMLKAAIISAVGRKRVDNH